MVVTLVPTLTTTVCFFNVGTLILISIYITAYIFNRCLSHGTVNEKGAAKSLDTVIANLLLTFGLPPSLPVCVTVVNSLFTVIVTGRIFKNLNCGPFGPTLVTHTFLLISFANTVAA